MSMTEDFKCFAFKTRLIIIRNSNENYFLWIIISKLFIFCFVFKRSWIKIRHPL